MALQTLEKERAPSSAFTRRKKERVAQIITEIQALESPAVEILFEDESHLTNEPYVQRGWSPKGQPHHQATPTKRERATIFGALHGRTQRFYWKRADRGNARAFIAFLHQLHQVFPDSILVLILDNSRIHTCKRVRRFLRRNTWVILKALPVYAPEYNPVERFWKWLKETVYRGQAFTVITQVVDRIRKVIWHYHEKGLIGSITFKLEAYQEIL